MLENIVWIEIFNPFKVNLHNIYILVVTIGRNLVEQTKAIVREFTLRDLIFKEQSV